MEIHDYVNVPNTDIRQNRNSEIFPNFVYWNVPSKRQVPMKLTDMFTTTTVLAYKKVFCSLIITYCKNFGFANFRFHLEKYNEISSTN